MDYMAIVDSTEESNEMTFSTAERKAGDGEYYGKLCF